MTNDEVINILDSLIGMVDMSNADVDEALKMAIKALKKVKAIKETKPPTDDWEHYADRLHDIAFQSGYAEGLKAKRSEGIKIADIN